MPLVLQFGRLDEVKALLEQNSEFGINSPIDISSSLGSAPTAVLDLLPPHTRSLTYMAHCCVRGSPEVSTPPFLTSDFMIPTIVSPESRVGVLKHLLGNSVNLGNRDGDKMTALQLSLSLGDDAVALALLRHLEELLKSKEAKRGSKVRGIWRRGCLFACLLEPSVFLTCEALRLVCGLFVFCLCLSVFL